MLLILDESMSGWKPKTSKLGGSPNCTLEPRKPVPLGTMFKNGAERKSGLIVFNDAVQNLEQQVQKRCNNLDSHSLDGGKVLVHTSEVLRQARGACVPSEGWVVGDAWFGSVSSCVELMKWIGVYSTFVIKTNTNFYSMIALYRILQARHKNRPAGHWAAMKTTIAGVLIMAIAYA